jgi:hypothetical protein
MKLISFDIGIKNMAYCIFRKNAEQIEIVDWNVISLMNLENPQELPKCTCHTTPKSKKDVAKPCTNSAKYSMGSHFYCEKHAKKTPEYIIPTKKHTLAFLKKQKVLELLKIGQSHNLFIEVENPQKLVKSVILEKIQAFYEQRCFKPIVATKSTAAGDIDLIQIGKNMKQRLDEIHEMNISMNHINGAVVEPVYIIIENQISTIANRMKTIQGMLAQYFIMKRPDIHIEFVSSANKLKQFSNGLDVIGVNYLENRFQFSFADDDSDNEAPLENTLTLSPVTANKNKKADYIKHKKDGIHYCSQIIEKYEPFVSWRTHVAQSKKKDDLADAFLQGIWYIQIKL